MVLEKTFESPLDCKEIQPVHPKGNQSWIFIRRTDAEARNSNTLAIWCEEPTHWKSPWCWEGLKAGEGDDRGWNGWMVSPTWWTWVWVNSRSWWWTGKEVWRAAVHGVAKSQTGLSNWTELLYCNNFFRKLAKSKLKEVSFHQFWVGHFPWRIIFVS